MFSLNIQSFIPYVRSFLLTSAAVSVWIIIARCLCRSSRFIFHRPVCFFQVLTFPRNSCIQSSCLTSVIIIISFALLERRGRRHSNKSSNSFLLNCIVNFRFLFFRILWLRTNLIRVIFRYFFLNKLFILPTINSQDFLEGLILKISE